MGRIDANNPDPPQDYDAAANITAGDDTHPLPPPTDDAYYYSTTPADNQSDQVNNYNQQYQQQQQPPQPTPAASYPPQNYHQPQPAPPQAQQPPAAQYPPPSNVPQPIQFPPPSPQMAGQPQSFPPQANAQPYLNPQPQAYPPMKPQQYPPAAAGGYNQQPQQYYPNPVGQYQMKPDAAPVGGIPIGSQYLPPTEGWRSGLLDCMDDPENAIITACFPCVTFGQIAEVIDNGQTSCATSGLLYGVIAAFIGVPCIMSCGYRSKLRSRYGLIEAPAPDWVTHCFCEWCALCQEYRELKIRGVDPAIGWQGNLARNNMQMQQGTMTPPVNQTMMG